MRTLAMNFAIFLTVIARKFATTISSKATLWRIVLPNQHQKWYQPL